MSTCSKCGREIPPEAPEDICPYCLLGEGLADDAEDSVPPPIHDENDLLFAIFAVQLKKLTPQAIMKAAAAWATDPSEDFGHQLVRDGLMSERDVALIRRLVAEAIAAHNGDSSATLETFGGEAELRRSLHLHQSEVPLRVQTVSETRIMEGSPPSVADRLRTISGSLPAVEELPGRYSQKSEHARGGQGRLLIVHDDELGRDIIMKELLNRKKKDGSSDTPVRKTASLVSRFLQEARVTGQLEHPSIVPVYELGRRSDGTLYYTMKLVKGVSFEERISQCKNLDERLALLPHFIQLCQGVAYAHTRGVVHRDLKPHNVMVGEFGETLVIDWGLAKVKGKDDEYDEALSHSLERLRDLHGDDSPNTLSGELLGTPMYMPPEQASGKIHLIDERADVYALGAMLFRMLSGETPYESTTIADLLEQIQTESPKDLLEVEPEAPTELAAICRRCMARDRRDRYRNAQELAADVERFQTGALVGAHSYSTAEIVRRVYKRHRAAFNVAFVSALILTVLTVYAIGTINASRNVAVQERDAARRNEYISTMHLVAELMRARNYDQANDMLFSTPPNLRDWEWGFLLNRCNLDVLRLDNSREAAFSPDGAFVATTSTSEPIRIWDAATGNLVKPITDEAARLLGVGYSQDGMLLFAPAFDDNIRVWRVESGKREYDDLGPHGSRITTWFRVPGTDTLLSGTAKGAIRCWSLRDGTLVNEFDASLGSVLDVQAGLALTYILSIHSRQTGENRGFRNTAQLFRVADKNPVLTDSAQAGAISRDETHIVLANRTVSTLYEVESMTRSAIWTDHRGYIRSVAFSPDGAVVATGGDDGKVFLYGVRERVLLFPPFDHGFAVSSVSFNTRGTHLLAKSHNGVFTVWSTIDGRRLNLLEGHALDVFGAQFDPSGDRILSTSLDNTVRIWNSVRTPGITDLRKYAAQLNRADFSHDGRLGAVLTDDGWLEIFDVEDRRILHEMGIASPSGGQCVAFSDSGNLIIAALDPFMPMIWDVQTGELVQTLPVHPGEVYDAAIFAHGTRAATACWDGRLRIWNLDSREKPIVIDAHEEPIRSIAISPDGQYLASGASDGYVRVWLASDGRLIREFEVSDNYIGEVGFSHGGTWLAASSLENVAKVWDLSSGKPVATIQGLARAMPRLVFTADDRRLITGSSSGTILVWDTADWATVTTINGDASSTVQLTMSDDGSKLLAAFDSGIVRRFEAAPWRSTEPDVGEQTDEDRFQHYRDEMRSEWQNDYFMDDAAQFAVWTTPEQLSESWERMLDPGAAQFVASEGNVGLSVVGPVPELMLSENTYVLQIEGGSIEPTESGLAGAREVVAKHLEDKRDDALNAVLNRGGRVQKASFEGIEPEVKAESKRITVEEANQIIALHLEAVEGNGDIRGLNNEAASSLGAAARERGLAVGVWLPETGGEEAVQVYKRLGMCPGDRIMSIDDQQLNGVNDLKTVYKRLLESDLADQDVNVHIQRGQFQRLDIRIHVTNE